jgi:hypothetical protein
MDTIKASCFQVLEKCLPRVVVFGVEYVETNDLTGPVRGDRQRYQERF